ncbi:SDR family oxidoreductase [Rhodohalobacter sp. SW132]|uniref:SDR family oxidoreductase n=1 Tax=Rhodohalobacter sp. SW132 TaxID=2293433 RepID=UPI000E263113|nr:SDR family oxidoreductase [Rhodohalobacter sp. SW132]REL38245.1 SDR family oxidoreductase [Rhodohalobacter sp. SW132]
MNKILLAGSTGYLGSFILKELLNRGYATRTITRNEKKLPKPVTENNRLEIVKAELTVPKSIKNCCRNVDTVISTVGITNQKDGLTYMDVDYQANLNLLEEAKRSGVKKFIYVSVLKGDQLTHLKICEAKEKFVSAVRNSGLDYCIIRPNGFFSDMGEFYEMAKKGRVYLFGNGEYKANPIHGADLAEICVNAIQSTDKEISVGGPQTLTHNQIAKIAFSVASKKPKITYIPDGIRKAVLFLLRSFTNSKIYGPIEFFMTVLSMDLIAPEYGTRTLKKYFEELKSAHNQTDSTDQI